MTQGEFAKGWKLLILQPWGWRYRGLDATGKPTEEAMTQMEFYFAKLQWAHCEAWWKVADMYAQGSEWPSVADLRNSLRQVNGCYVKALNAPQAGYPNGMPAEVREMVERIGK
jgi:hypothetical protein